jgi:hypothetical protein
VDNERSAERLANDFVPRLGALLPGGNRGKGEVPKAPVAGESRQIGVLNGRALMFWWRDRNVMVAWGERDWVASLNVRGKLDRSVASLCDGWTRQGRGAPQRIGLVWPARCVPPFRGVDTTNPAFRVLADDPPVVWWGWTGPGTALDVVESAELKERVHRFLEQIPLDPSQKP